MNYEEGKYYSATATVKTTEEVEIKISELLYKALDLKWWQIFKRRKLINEAKWWAKLYGIELDI